MGDGHNEDSHGGSRIREAVDMRCSGANLTKGILPFMLGAAAVILLAFSVIGCAVPGVVGDAGTLPTSDSTATTLPDATATTTTSAGQQAASTTTVAAAGTTTVRVYFPRLNSSVQRL
jgi:hypothetical protein